MSLEIKVCKNVLLTHLVTIREYIIQNLKFNMLKKLRNYGGSLYKKSIQLFKIEFILRTFETMKSIYANF